MESFMREEKRGNGYSSGLLVHISPTYFGIYNTASNSVCFPVGVGKTFQVVRTYQDASNQERVELHEHEINGEDYYFDVLKNKVDYFGSDKTQASINSKYLISNEPAQSSKYSEPAMAANHQLQSSINQNYQQMELATLQYGQFGSPLSGSTVSSFTEIERALQAQAIQQAHNAPVKDHQCFDRDPQKFYRVKDMHIAQGLLMVKIEDTKNGVSEWMSSAMLSLTDPKFASCGAVDTSYMPYMPYPYGGNSNTELVPTGR